MKGRQAILGHIGENPVAALMVDGRLEDVLVPDPDSYAVGAILRAVVDRPVKGMGGAFVRLPEGTGFLRQAKGLAPGQAITVQVTGQAEPGKAVPVTTRLLFKSRYAIVTPGRPGINISRTIKDEDIRDQLEGAGRAALDGEECGLILRSAAAGADLEEVIEDAHAMIDQAVEIGAEAGTSPELLIDGPDPHALAWREWYDVDQVQTDPKDLELSGALEAIEAAQNPQQPLKSGSLWIEPTRALVAVDVNTGNSSVPSAALNANLDAAKFLPRLLRLRGLAGQITIDFAPMNKRDRKPIETALKAAFRACPVETEFVGWTPLGHTELKRKRERPLVGAIL